MTPNPHNQAIEYERHGIIGFDWKKKIKDRTTGDSSHPLLELLMYLWPGSWSDQKVCGI